MLYERYRGTFGSREGKLWRVSLLQESQTAYVVGELDFPFEDRLIIEWPVTGKEDVIVSSTATLRVISPGDRTYEDLYSIEPGKIRMDVYCNEALYWSGCLDPEFYEEPYTSNSDYEVELVFSDFGILDRLKYDLTGIQNCGSLLDYMLMRSGIGYQYVDKSGMSTTVPGARGSDLTQLDVRSDNFYDEDGEALSMKEVVEGILRPLGLRMEQRNGVVWIYDLNGAYSTFATQQIYWMSDDQMMGTDKVVNDAKVKLSVYADSKLMDGVIKYPGTYSEDTTDLTNTDNGVFSYYVDYSNTSIDNIHDYGNISFTVFTSSANSQSSGIAEKGQGARWFHIQPLLGGESASGVSYMFMTGGHGPLDSGWPQRIGGSPDAKSETLLMRTHRVYLPKLPAEEMGTQYTPRYLLRLQQEMMIDPRYNPYTESNDQNESGNYRDLKVWFGYVMIPITVTLYGEDGTALMHYSNESIARGSSSVGSLGQTLGEWKEGAGHWGECWLEWYDPDDRAENSGVLGWKKNRHCVGLSTRPLYKSFAAMTEGQYIPYPSEGGYLEVCVYAGIWPYDYGETDFNSHRKTDQKHLYERIRWMLYKAPVVEIVKGNIKKSDADANDITYRSHINVAAKEDLEIETICGTAKRPIPASKALYLNATTGEQVTEMTRGGRTTQVEQLLLGTLYSQFASRKTTLTGTSRLNVGELHLYTDAMQAGKKFICVGEFQNVQEDSSEIVIIELRPDEYNAIDN